MNPSPLEISEIRSFVASLAGGWSNTDAEIRARMTSTLVPNPIVSAPVIPVPFQATDLVMACSAGNRPNLESYLVGAASLIIAQDVPHLTEGINAMAEMGSISAADATAMIAVLNRTQADPSWTSQVSWDLGTLGRPVDDFDLEEARR